ncbi:uncharacterized protein LOC126559905 [Anopheles maculipalpis]|uniref:uncharacterized protein LOC126559905 n=1 Tax=Anopheles maculipalpis TaxID=1496333 RepID=UPI0021593E48|nr:uncharacterized protein LOC126559905 [Anopheles maculipalpis]
MASKLAWLCVGAILCSLANLAHTNPIETVTAHNPLSVPTVADSTTLDTVLPTKGADVASSTETSKMSRFLDDFTSAFKQGTAKMKESIENAATSVKDGVLQGYDYVRSKLTGTGTESSTPVTSVEEANATGASTSTAAALTSSATPSTERTAISGLPATDTKNGPSVLGGVVGVSNEPARIVPNDDEDDERIFFNDKDYTAVKPLDGSEDERDVTESPVTTTVTVDNRFIIAGPLACKSGQEVVNGKCRNVF